MNERNTELNKLILSCLQELRGIYASEHSIRIFIACASIYYLTELDQKNDSKLQWARVAQELSMVNWLEAGMKQIENEHEEFRGVFTGLIDSFLNYSHRSANHSLERVMINLNHYRFHNQDEIVQLINLAAHKYADYENHGTPAAITNLALSMVHLDRIQSFADFCSGISSMYLEMARRLKVSEPASNVSYYGEELNVFSYLISKLLMLLNRVAGFTIVNKDVLDFRSSDEPHRTFDFIFSDARFGAAWNPETVRSDSRFEFGIPPKSSADWAFYQNAVFHLNENGKAIAVGTKGTLVRETEAHIRESVVEKDLIEAVITLPENLYFKTGISTELIIFNKRKPKQRQGKILFIDASNYSYRINRNQKSITDEGISKIVHAYWDGMDEERFCRLVGIHEVRSSNFNLNSKRYLDFDRLKNSFHQAVKLGEISEIRRGVQLSKEEYEELGHSATHYFLNIKDIENGIIRYDEQSRITCKKQDWLNKFAIKPQDIIITSKGSTIKFAIVEVPFHEAFISGNLSMIRVDPTRYNPYVLYEFLQSDTGRRMIDALQTGTTIKLINPSKLEQLEVPVYPLAFMNKVGEKLQQNKQVYEKRLAETEQKYALEKRKLLEEIGIESSSKM